MNISKITETKRNSVNISKITETKRNSVMRVQDSYSIVLQKMYM
jgi:hypothetical protein